jgi:hypothetical protein
MKPYRFISHILGVAILVGMSFSAYAVKPYSPLKGPNQSYKRAPVNLASGYKLPPEKSLASNRAGAVPFSRSYLHPLKSWSGLSGADRRMNGDLSPTGDFLARSKSSSYGKKNGVSSRYLGTKVIAPRGRYSVH